jgi:hypothetical protein
MVPRLVFAALVFCSLASRPDGTPTRRRVGADPRQIPAQAQATIAPAVVRPACP